MVKNVNEYLDQLAENAPKAVKGIPGREMNRPVVAANELADVGLELEIEGASLPSAGMLERIKAKSGARWDVHNDGSLRGEALEYVLSRPCKIEEVEGLLVGLWGKFKDNGTRFDLSNRCSTHVHVNVGGKKVNELTSIIGLWTALEEPLINWCGEERVTNHFCLSSKDTGALVVAWDNFLMKGTLGGIGEGMKYSSLNIRPISSLGSFEFRCMRASETYEPLLDWTKFVYGLTDYATRNYQNPQSLAGEVSERGGEELFCDVAKHGGCSREFIVGVLKHSMNEDFSRMVLEGFRRVQPIILGHPWYDWMEGINKEYIYDPFKKPKKNMYDEILEIRMPDPRGIRFEDAFRGVQEARPVPPAPNQTAAPIRQRHLRPKRLNLERPFMFNDGTPAILLEINDARTLVRARALVEPAIQRPDMRDLSRREGYWYEVGTGFYAGGRGTVRLENIIAEDEDGRFPEEDEEVENQEIELDPMEDF